MRADDTASHVPHALIDQLLQQGAVAGRRLAATLHFLFKLAAANSSSASRFDFMVF